MDKSVSVSSDNSEPYTAMPLVQELISGHSHSDMPTKATQEPGVAPGVPQSQKSADIPKHSTTDRLVPGQSSAQGVASCVPGAEGNKYNSEVYELGTQI